MKNNKTNKHIVATGPAQPARNKQTANQPTNQPNKQTNKEKQQNKETHELGKQHEGSLVGNIQANNYMEATMEFLHGLAKIHPKKKKLKQ